MIGHRPEGGQVYEIGHTLRVMETFGSYKEAQVFLDSAVLFNELSDKGVDYVLVGRFHDQRLELDIEGYALPHSGLTLLTATHNYENGHDYHEVHSLFQPATLEQYFFAGLRDEKLALFNHKLEPTAIGLPQQPFYPLYYNHDYLTTKNHTTMNQDSFDYNKNMLLNMGFGDEIAKDLHTKMDQNLAEFTLNHRREFGKDAVESVLYFTKGDQEGKDITFFNKFDATLKKENMEDLKQTFFVGSKYNYTLQERYNMMDGRFAYREQPKMKEEMVDGKAKMVPTGETYLAWRGLDFKNADGYGNFLPKVLFCNLEKELKQYPVKGIEDKYDLSKILRPLNKGNKVDVILLRDGVETPAKIVANPKMQRVDFFDENGQNLLVRKVQKQAVSQTPQPEMTPQQVQQVAIAKAAAAKEQNQTQQQSQSPQSEQQNSQQVMQRESAAQKADNEQRQEQGPRRRQGVRVG